MGSSRANTGKIGQPGQLTGLKDKNGVDICVGDTVAFDARIWHRQPRTKKPDHEFVVGWDPGESALDICGSANDMREYCRVVIGWDGKIFR